MNEPWGGELITFPGRRKAQLITAQFLRNTNEQPFPFSSSIVTADATLNP